jgi:hypothetical protein
MNELKREVEMLREALELEKKKEKSAPCSLFSVCLPLEDKKTPSREELGIGKFLEI